MIALHSDLFAFYSKLNEASCEANESSKSGVCPSGKQSYHRWSLLKREAKRCFGGEERAFTFSLRISSNRMCLKWILENFVGTLAYMAGGLCQWPRVRWDGWFGSSLPSVRLLWLDSLFIRHSRISSRQQVWTKKYNITLHYYQRICKTTTLHLSFCILYGNCLVCA